MFSAAKVQEASFLRVYSILSDTIENLLPLILFLTVLAYKHFLCYLSVKYLTVMGINTFPEK
jgi:hypothetical protein